MEIEAVSFEDTTGYKWHLNLTVGAFRRVKQEADFDLSGVAEGGEKTRHSLIQLMTDPLVLADILYAACQPQAEKAGIDSSAFGERLAGPVIKRAREALLEAIVNFTQSPEQMEVAEKNIATMKRLEKMAMEAMMEGIKSLDDTETLMAIKLMLGNIYGGLPGFSDLIPTPSVIES